MDDHDRDPKHAPEEPTADKLPVEPEMDKGQDPSGLARQPKSEPPAEKRSDDH